MAETLEPAEPETPQQQEPRRQQELPFAVVAGEPITEVPTDLYIPPDALGVILEAFEGPLDLLLYLIKRQNLDILEVKVADITQQYMDYIDLMGEVQFELAAEYLVMAALLTEIKSRMLLPRREEDQLEEDDPRAELIRRLQEYERFKEAAQDVNALPRVNRDFWVASAEAPVSEKPRPMPEVQLKEMLIELSRVLKRAENYTSHHVAMEPLSTRERMSDILERVNRAGDQFVPFLSLFTPEEGRAGIVVTFLAMMELVKESLLEIIQTEPFAPVHVKVRGEAVSA